jgi:hypothetical protein
MRHNVSFATPMRFCFDTRAIAADAPDELDRTNEMPPK